MRRHPAAASSIILGGAYTPTPSSDRKSVKKRGNYNCGHCGLPKKGHNCKPRSTTSTPHATAFAAVSAATTPTSGLDLLSSVLADPNSTPFSAVAGNAVPHPVPHPRQHRYNHRLPLALSFDDIDATDLAEEREGHGESDVGLEFDYGYEDGSGGLPGKCVWEILKRLPPASLLSAARVCKGWRECCNRLWKAAEEIRLRVPARSQIEFTGSLLQKCSGLVRLSLRIESDVYATMLACIAFSCPNLESMEISTSDASINRITGDELGRFVVDKRCLLSLKMEGCSNIGALVLSSNSLSTLWLSDLHSLSKTVLHCPSLTEISLAFSCQPIDNTDLTTMMDNLGRYCPKLHNIHIASTKLSHSAVPALTAANLRGLRMLSLVMGSGITDASVAAISSSYPTLDLLDLSGSSITDSGIGMICNVFSQSLSRLLLALCPNLTSSGIQFAMAQLPLLELMDCGMTILDHDSDDPLLDDKSDSGVENTPKRKSHLIYQKLIVKHGRLKKLSLWGCSGLDALSLNCPQLIDLNLNSCKNLNHERLFLQCPYLETIHASGCQGELVEAIQSQVDGKNFPIENQWTSKRMGDGSKRISIPHRDFLSAEPTDDVKMQNARKKRRCNVVVE
ncbi:hypothetical protein Dimus_036257 [Dionaea muscipula]